MAAQIILVRHFAPADIEAAHALWKATPGIGMSAADEEASLVKFLARNPGMSYVAVQGDGLAGTVLCGHDGRRGLIHHLATAAGSRRQGIGRRLLRSALDALRQEGIDKCHLLVFRDNKDGLAFWRAVRSSERHELALFSLATDNAV